MSKKSRNNITERIIYGVIILIGIAMIYPLIWMFFASFKSNEEIFGSLNLLPNSFNWSAYSDGWKSAGGVTYTRFFLNTFILVLPTTLFTVASSALVAYGFARFEFPGKRLLFAVLIATLMLPNAVIIIPRYTIFRSLGALDSYWPFYLTAIFACYPFFTYMLIQFLRGLPKDLDESAYIDGCGTFKTFTSILLPLLKPSLFSAGLFQFLWTYNDYFNSLIYINTVTKYTVSLALRLSLDAETVVQWNKVMAMACVAVLPVVVLFFCCQRYFVDGIATTGLKG
ncbi:carbohydrate ABC transporter permease [Anaerocolumna sp. MB42-C2]|uniref:carbohydrate ABC transporter permease n=1 Tax=Anaerocolumna sp. MB42-C2 TaxID=3070997 RepID=UPI0027E00451|nr:carbohydrate ABC transporter permease [Anaerocolumna sp. MB42-C2]WMJ87265.1 carbohydrate ABC transporter permease [Anaerocolumna sp. MB42-C2]